MIPSDALLNAYANGWFPMAVAPGDIRWYSPDPRGIIPLDTFHVPARLARTLRTRPFEIRIDSAFRAVIEGCAERQDEDGNWIDGEIIESYCALHEQGIAHSVEAWQDGRLAGGLYGVALGGAFFGESMFHRVARRLESGAGRRSSRSSARAALHAPRHPVGHRASGAVRRGGSPPPPLPAAARSGARAEDHVRRVNPAELNMIYILIFIYA